MEWRETCTMLGLVSEKLWVCSCSVAGFAGEIFFFPSVYENCYIVSNTRVTRVPVITMEVCCSPGNYCIRRWNFTKLCFDPGCWIFAGVKISFFSFSSSFFLFLSFSSEYAGLINQFRNDTSIRIWIYFFDRMWLNTYSNAFIEANVHVKGIT